MVHRQRIVLVHYVPSHSPLPRISFCCVSGLSAAPSGQAGEERLNGCSLGGEMEEGIQLVVASSASVRLRLIFFICVLVVTCISLRLLPAAHLFATETYKKATQDASASCAIPALPGMPSLAFSR
jgi:hypothetical protein